MAIKIHRRRLKNRTSIDYFKKNPGFKQLYYTAAITNNGKCCICKKEIPKGSPIFWYWDKFRKAKKTKIPQIEEKPTELNIKRKICFRCIDEEIFKDLLARYKEEIKKIKELQKSFKRSLKGKKCKRGIENILVLEELRKEEFVKNFNSNKLHG